MWATRSRPPREAGFSRLIAVFLIVAVLGIVMQFTIFRWMEGQDLRQTLVTIALSLILADLMLWRWGGDFYQVPTPSWLAGPIEVPLVTAVRSSGELVYLQYPLVRLVILLGAVVIGVLMWLALNRTKVGMLVRAGVDDRDMLSATGIRVQLIFVLRIRLRCRACRLHRRRSAARSSRCSRARTSRSCSPRWSS